MQGNDQGAAARPRPRPARLDGRRQRSLRTRQAIIEAYLGLLRVPAATIDAAVASGATPWQRLRIKWKLRKKRGGMKKVGRALLFGSAAGQAVAGCRRGEGVGQNHVGWCWGADRCRNLQVLIDLV